MTRVPDPSSIYILAPAGALRDPAALDLASRRLEALGFSVTLDPAVALRHQRFAGDDAARLDAFQRALAHPAGIVMAARGGYGLTRLLDRMDWSGWAQSGKRFVGYSDCTAFSLGLLAQTGAGSDAGPLAVADFAAPQVHPGMQASFLGALRQAPELARFEAGHAGAPWQGECEGMLWGGNLALVCNLVGTPYMPEVDGGILFLEDVGESPYRIERMLTQLLHAGILARQQAVLLGRFTALGQAATHEGHALEDAFAWLASRVDVPLITGLPHGHVPEIVTLPVGARARLRVSGGQAELLRI